MPRKRKEVMDKREILKKWKYLMMRTIFKRKIVISRCHRNRKANSHRQALKGKCCQMESHRRSKRMILSCNLKQIQDHHSNNLKINQRNLNMSQVRKMKKNNTTRIKLSILVKKKKKVRIKATLSQPNKKLSSSKVLSKRTLQSQFKTKIRQQ